MQHRAVIAIFLSFVFSLPLMLTDSLAEGGDQLWMFQGIEDINAMATIPDVDGDGIPDVVIETYDAGGDGDHLYLVSGGSTGSPSVIWSARPNSGASNGGGYGDNCLATCPDISGDGFTDVLLGTAWGNRSVHAFDGRTGAVLWTFDTYDEADSGWVYSVASHPDRNGDGLPEVLAAVGSDNDGGYLLSGADGSILWRFISSLDALSLAISLPDMNGDFIPDVLFTGQDNDHRAYCVSGAGGPYAGIIWYADTGGSNHGACLIDDISGDQKPEVVVGSWQTNNQVRCLSGADGSPRWMFDNGTYNYIMRLVTLSDMDGDGYRDIAIGSWDNAVRVVSGLDGTLIWESYGGTLNGGDFWSVERVDDITGDGLDEVVGGSFDHNVYLFDGASGDTLWMHNTARRLYSVRGAPDLSGDGSPDVLAGTQYLTWGGRAFALEGGDRVTGGAPSGPFASGRATISADEREIELVWHSNRQFLFNVYRAEESQERGAGRTALIASHAAGELSSRELLAAVRALPGESLGELVNAAPILPDAYGWCWNYRLVDEVDLADEDGRDVRYRLAAYMSDGSERVLAELSPEPAVPPQPLFAASGVHPNPFNPSATVRFTLREMAEIAVHVNDSRGRRVASIPSELYPAGDGEIEWKTEVEKGARLPSGVYFVTLLANNGERRTMRAVLIK